MLTLTDDARYLREHGWACPEGWTWQRWQKARSEFRTELYLFVNLNRVTWNSREGTRLPLLEADEIDLTLSRRDGPVRGYGLKPTDLHHSKGPKSRAPGERLNETTGQQPVGQ